MSKCIQFLVLLSHFSDTYSPHKKFDTISLYDNRGSYSTYDNELHTYIDVSK